MPINVPHKTMEKIDLARDVYRFLAERGTVSKQSVCDKFNISERKARDLISFVAQRTPVISTSDTKGYRLAKSVSDVEDVNHTIKELESRIEELQKRINPLRKFLCDL